MSAGPDPTEGSARRLKLEDRARAFAREHRDIVNASHARPSFNAARISRALSRTKAALLAGDPTAGVATVTEWFLDNAYLLLLAARQIGDDLPRNFDARLPRIASGASEGTARVDALARALLSERRGELDEADISCFVVAFQESTPLTIAELWALPTMLRAAALRRTLRSFVELGVTEADTGMPWDDGPIEPSTGVERAVRTLRVLGSIDWKKSFERWSRVDRALHLDPSKFYSRMDFLTADRYRKAVEELAWASGTTEEGVAHAAVELATRGNTDAERHVGHYLAGPGRGLLEARFGYRASWAERALRLVRDWATLAHLGTFALATVAPLSLVAVYLGISGATEATLALGLMLALLPATIIASSAVHRLVAQLFRPVPLPKLDFTAGIPDDARTLVAIPALLGGAADVHHLVRVLELHYLANPDANLSFALLTDGVDTEKPSTDTAALTEVSSGVAALNTKYGAAGVGPFHVLHRAPRWNAAENRYMGWERKRGKLEELNRLLRGDRGTTYATHVGDPAGLARIRFVLTLDSDSELPMGAANRLLGILAHPLNRPVFDEQGRVVSGYTIVQPRVEVSPNAERVTRFARLFAGDVGFDVYTNAVSDTYQDLFGAGIYVGKGLYDIDAFARSLEGRVPENTLASHDLFEGIHGRTALATDVVVFEDYPDSYAAFARRAHRWIRGDWQLLPWLLPWVPSRSGAWLRNGVSFIDRWKIVDNVRRSLAAPAVMLMLVVGARFMPGNPFVWVALALAALVSPIVPALRGTPRARTEALGRGALEIVFLAHQSWLVVDAAVRALVRMTITQKHLLQWTTAAETARSLRGGARGRFFWRELIASPILAAAILLLFLTGPRPLAVIAVLPVLLAWTIAPEIARWISERIPPPTALLDERQRRTLRKLARRTWHFFETFIGPSDQWLPVDNHQEAPVVATAHRTSPTNIGLLLVSTVAAYDLGYLGPTEVAVRLRSVFDTIAKLEHHKGHLLNWYDTRTLEPLLPRYVSTVDSGNFAGCLIALAEACREIGRAPVLRAASWDGLTDTLDLFLDACTDAGARASTAIDTVTTAMAAAIARGRGDPSQAHARLTELCDDLAPALDHAILALVAEGSLRHEPELLSSLRTWLGTLERQLTETRRGLASLLPWLAWENDAMAMSLGLAPMLPLVEIPAACHLYASKLDEWTKGHPGPVDDELEKSIHRRKLALGTASEAASSLLTRLSDIGAHADTELSGMGFGFLFNPTKKLFHIGLNVTQEQLDLHHYDLLASEARLASYLAVVRRQVPEAHWYALGRPMTTVRGRPALASWGGTMFEYLMPTLFMRSSDGTLLGDSCAAAVRAEIDYGHANGEPWGVSESAYARLDADQIYQYQSFGVPALGLKRGLEDDHVVAPYASLLAVAMRPTDVLDNLVRLAAEDMVGAYGLFEALDFTPSRVAAGSRGTIVRTYMAHHQGMVLVALDNALSGDAMVRRFHADPRIQCGAHLLNERMPAAPPIDHAKPEAAGETNRPETATAPIPAPWTPHERLYPEVQVLGNGRLASLLTDSGGGGLTWQGIALTAYRRDPTDAAGGLWIHIRDHETNRVWRATSGEGPTTFAAHTVSFARRTGGLSVHVDVAVAAADDVEVRIVTLHNETARRRSLGLTSAAEPVLVAEAGALQHPAFERLFLEVETVEHVKGVLVTRRSRTDKDARAIVVHRLVHEGRAVTFAGANLDRESFYGRCGDPRSPRARGKGDRPTQTLDPLMSVSAAVVLEPNETVTLAFVTAAAASRSDALAIAERYGSLHAARWAIRDAGRDVARRLSRSGVEPHGAQVIQRLLSALLVADPALRPPPDALAAARPSLQGLWGRGISGDDPILAIAVHDPASPLVAECLAAQTYLRTCGVRFDVVFVDHKVTGYFTDGPGSLDTELTRLGADELLHKKGGVHALARDQLSDNELANLAASARVLLDTRDGTLEAQLGRTARRAPDLPQFQSTQADDSVARAPVYPPLLFATGAGGFSADGREYVVRVEPGNPLPAPWCNVLANATFGCLVSESSLGMSWSENSGENRLTPWRNDPLFDAPSEALYLRDELTAAVWTPTPLPCGRDVEMRVHHGAGYTTYASESHGLVQELTVFVPPGVGLKVVRLRLRNVSSRQRRLTATYYAEWVLGSVREQQAAYIVPELDRANACLLATCGFRGERAGRTAFLASSAEPHGVTADRTEFLGRSGDWSHPAALARWGLSGRVAAGDDPCAAIQVHLELGPDESLETHFVLGESKTKAEALAVVAAHRDPASIDAAWAALTEYWDGMLSAVRVATPEPAMDLLLNRWLLYQTLSARFFGRTGYYQSSGAFGFRDQLQDVMAFFHAAPALARAHILDAAAHQFEEGDVLHWWHPPSGRGVRTRCSDDMVWLAFVTEEYVRATGDVGILDERVPFLAGAVLRDDEHDRYAEFAHAHTSEPLFEHLRRALERGLTEGKHGLPLMGASDWNDGMDLVGKEGRGESVWLGWFLLATMTRFATLCDRRGLGEDQAEWTRRADALREKLEASAWDGAWYVRAFHDDGSVLGSSKSVECRIDSIAQSWSVLSGAADETRQRTALASASQYLVDEQNRLVLLLTPPLSRNAHDPGYIGAYPPGVRENGGQYTHAATWLGFAHAAIGDGDGAEKIFRLLNPILRGTSKKAVDWYRVEPYVLAGDVYGGDRWAGRGGWTWYTGAAGWAWRLGVEEILGIGLADGELRIEPCIPPTWPRFEAWVRHGEASIHVIVENPDGVSRGVSEVTVDGVAVSSNRVNISAGRPIPREVHVRLGRDARASGSFPVAATKPGVSVELG